MLVGYARVSSAGQSLDVQIEALTAAGCEKIYSEKRSGRTAVDRVELARTLDQLRSGDQLVVTRLDRLARSVGDLHRILEQVASSSAAFQCLQQGGVDTATSTGKLMLAILGAVAEFENDIRRERQRDGIEKAKERGVYRGRPATIDYKRVEALSTAGNGPAAIARSLGISRASVYRLMARRPRS
ncbi:recombinase family protein [Sphingomonas sp. AAP5]|uniref:recombinase family protein n=1 Tax=Sphingomonas sp. AAP5 TaxID=1523415 RepID=UPI0010571F91|nr:recombinase family protein [Sphingomonas sp. AAP5]QBM75880.1 recombinase family protein [Sphingomonas sp. AAP5]